MAWQSLYDWCIENGDWGKQLLHEFGEGNNEQIYENPNGMPQCPQDFSCGTNKKIKWTCKNNNQHVWEASVYSRVSRRTLCPFCSGRKASEDNNLLTWCEQNGDWGQRIINEWTGLNENNEHVKMTDFTKASGKRVKWKCSVPTCSYEWVNSVHDRTSHRRGCPFCANQVVVDGKNDLKTWCLNNAEYRGLIDMWTGIDENNNKVEITQVSKGSHKRMKWKCDKGHEWINSINEITSRNSGNCPLCSGYVLAAGVNDLASWCENNEDWGEKLKSEWVGLDENNNKIEMTEIARGSGRKVYWQCDKGHKWLSDVKNRTQSKSNCPYCTKLNRPEINHKAALKVGQNDLLTWCKQNKDLGQQLINEWTGLDENNTPVEMWDCTTGSSKKVLWKCNNQHTWLSTIYNRVNGNKCPYCSGKIASEEYNLLEWCKQNGDWGQRLISEWMGTDENSTLVKMTEFTSGSNKRVLWKCSKNHTWYASLHERTTSRYGCPICNSKVIKAGENDLLTWCNANGAWGEKLKKEWLNIDEDGNKIEMTEVARASSKKVKWRCSKNHEFFMTISSRTYKRNGCPFCNKRGTSYPEQFLYRSLKQLYPQTINRGRYQGYEYDIAIPEERLCIEYSPTYWHDSKVERDEEKLNLCEKHGVRFIYIREDYKDKYEHCFEEDYICYKASNNKEEHNQQLTEILQHVLNSLGHDISEINIEQAQTEAFNFMHSIEESEDEEELDDF